MKPSDVCNKLWTEIAHAGDAALITDTIAAALAHGDQSVNVTWRMHVNHDYVPVQTSTYKFTNPYSDEFEYLVATHTVACSSA